MNNKISEDEIHELVLEITRKSNIALATKIALYIVIISAVFLLLGLILVDNSLFGYLNPTETRYISGMISLVCSSMFLLSFLFLCLASYLNIRNLK